MSGTYFSVIPRDLFMLIVSESLIDRVYELHNLRPDKFFWADLYFLKFRKHPLSEINAKKEFDEILNVYWYLMEEKAYGYGIEAMAKLGMLNEVFEFIRLGGTEINKFHYRSAILAAAKGKWITLFKILLESYLTRYDIDNESYQLIIGAAAAGGDLNIFNKALEIDKNRLNKNNCVAAIASAAFGDNQQIIDVLLPLCGKLNEQDYINILAWAAAGKTVICLNNFYPK